MEDLVGVGTADPGQQARVGEGTLERVVLPPERLAELGLRGLERLDPAPIESHEPALAGEGVERRAPLRARLGQGDGPVGEVEGGEPHLAWQPRTGGLPVEATGDHEVEAEEEVAVERQDDPLPHPRHRRDAPSGDGGERGLDGPEQEGAAEPHPLERPAQDPVAQGLDVHLHVRELGHGAGLYREMVEIRTCARPTCPPWS